MTTDVPLFFGHCEPFGIVERDPHFLVGWALANLCSRPIKFEVRRVFSHGGTFRDVTFTALLCVVRRHVTYILLVVARV